MKNTPPFQIALYAFFVVLLFVSVLLLALFTSSSNSGETQQYGPTLEIWGTFSADAINPIFNEIAEDIPAFSVASYREIDPRSFDQEFLVAAAEDRAPDLVFLSSERLVEHRSKLAPWEFVETDFVNTYVDGAAIFHLVDGQYAQPLVVDPLVMYWNRDMFAENGLAQPPTTWQEVVSTITPRLTRRDDQRTILQSAVALGEYTNVNNARGILSMLLLQAGSQMVTERNNQYQILLNTPLSGVSGNPLETTIRFYTNFARPDNQLYSWNRVQPNDQNAFAAGDVALYFGYASEFTAIERRNPNINFGVAPVPQGANTGNKRTYAHFYGVAVPKKTNNLAGAYNAIGTIFSNPVYTTRLATALAMAPAHRSVLQGGSNVARTQTTYEQTLISRAWLTPVAEEIDPVLAQLVSDIVSNRARVEDAVNSALSRIRLLY